MKILFISDFFPPYIYGGAEVSTSLLVESLAASHDVTVITSQLAESAWTWNGVRIIPALVRHDLGDKSLAAVVRYGIGSITRPLRNTLRLIRVVRTEPADILNFVASSYASLPTIVLVSLLTRKRVVVDMRDFTSICLSDFSFSGYKESTRPHSCFSHVHTTHATSSRVMKFILPLIDVYEVALFELYKFVFKTYVNHRPRIELVSLSHYVKRKLTQNGVRVDKITVIPNICLIDRRPPDDVPLRYDFAFAGRLERAKGIWQTIHAFERLHRNDVTLAIAGDGTEFDKIAAYLQSKQLTTVTLLGRLPPEEVLHLYRSAKFIVAPVIRPEPFGRFIQESITTGTPVIATAVGGIPEGVIEGETGFLVAPGTRHDLERVMKKAMLLPEDMLRTMRALTRKQSATYEASTVTQARMRLYGKEDS